jgi:hypothetical protein
MSMTPAEVKRRASEARRLLEEPLLVEAFDHVERMASEAIFAIPTWHRFGDKKRARLADQVNAIRAVKSILHTHIALGEQADKPIRRWA